MNKLMGHVVGFIDTGIFFSYSIHEAHSYYLVRNADLLGFDQAEISTMFFIKPRISKCCACNDAFVEDC